MVTIATPADKKYLDAIESLVKSALPRVALPEGFTLSEAAQQRVQAHVEQLLPGIALRFETDAQQAPGLVLRVGGAQVSWTIDSYIDEFDAMLNERLAAGTSGRMQAPGG